MHAFEGTKQIGCAIASNGDRTIAGLLNNAWESFWKDPSNYTEWEKHIIATIKQAIRPKLY